MNTISSPMEADFPRSSLLFSFNNFNKSRSIIQLTILTANSSRDKPVTNMSEKLQKYVSPEMTDLPAFQGKTFENEPCPECQLHLAVIGHGICVPCMNKNDAQAEDVAFDPELQDVVHGLGDTSVW